MMFSVDGTTWDMPCGLERVAEIRSSEISGMLLDKNYFNDVLGTFMQYTVTVAIPTGQESDYAFLYDVLADPVDAHTFVFPYNQDEITIVGRVSNIADSFWREVGGVKIWRKTKFTVTANHPSKTYTLYEMIARGISPMPSAEKIVQIGDIYQLTASGWEQMEMINADDRYY